MKTHFIFDLKSGMYGRWDATKTRLIFDAPSNKAADLLEQDFAANMGNYHFGQNTHGTLWELREATFKEVRSWRARQGGSAKTAAKARAVRRNGAKAAPVHRKAARERRKVAA